MGPSGALFQGAFRLYTPKGCWPVSITEAGGQIGGRARIEERQPRASHPLLRVIRDQSQPIQCVDQLHDEPFGFGVVAGCEDDGAGLARREVLYPGHRHIADRFDKRCANCHLSDHLARSASLQRSPRSGDTCETDIGFGIHMRVRRIDQNSATPIDAFQRFRHVHPMYSENNDVARGRLLPGPCDGARTMFSHKICQCLRTPGIRYKDGMTSGDQMAAESACYGTASIKPAFINRLPFSGWTRKRECTSSDSCNQPSFSRF